jgi:site-specific DNA-methyltransferase (adenine-specific)
MSDIKLIHGDCLEKMGYIPDGSVDCIITDPPYNIGYADWDIFGNIEELSSEMFRILKNDGSLFLFSGWSFVATVITKVDKKFKLNDWIIYDRIKGRGALKRLVSTREDLLWYVKSDKWTFNKSLAYSTIKKKTGGLGLKNGQQNRALSNVWTDISPIVPWSSERVNHPTQKPVQLMERIVSVFTNEYNTVLDCFMGSCSTGIACLNTNRNFIGIEKDDKYFEVAKKRIEETKC